MSLQNNPQSFTPQNGVGLRPKQSPHFAPLAPGAQPASASYNRPGHPSNAAQDLLFIHPMPMPWQTFQNDQPWMPGQPMGAGSTLLMQERTSNPDIGMASLYPPSRSNPMAIHGCHHLAGVPLGMNAMEHR